MIEDPKEFANFKAGLKTKYARAYKNKVPHIPLDSGSFALTSNEFPFHNALIKHRPRLLLILSVANIGGADQFNFNFVKGNIISRSETFSSR